MKKSTLFGSALLAMAVVAPQAYADNIYDQTAWNNDQVLKLFSDAWDAGRNYPTDAQLEAIGMGMELEFARSHTRFRPIDKDASKDVVSAINHDRRLWLNFPGGYGKNTGGYPSSEYDQDVFSLWNYTHLFGAWNYGFQEVAGCWVDAAHKNGTRIYGGIKFFESWNNSGEENTFKNFIATKATSGKYTYKYSRAFVNAACYMGNDGFNYNQEGSLYSDNDWVSFHAEVKNIARELGLEGFGIGQYTQNSSISSTSVSYLYGSTAKGGAIYDCMLNYSGGNFATRSIPTSISAIDGAGLSPEDCYQGGWIVGLSTLDWTGLNSSDTNKRMNICFWGEHDQSRFFQFRIGEDPISTQENYQLLLEKGFSGANRNPLNLPAINNSWGSFQVGSPELASTQLNNACGVASMIPERTAIVGKLPFETYFNLGNGENYFYKGKVTHGSWYNMSQQDIVPTYRWLVTAKNSMTTYANDIDARFTHADAYMGGSSLKITGATTSGNDLVLYRTKLNVSSTNPKVTIALKSRANGASHMSVIVKKAGSTSWIELPCGDVTTAWQVKELPLTSVAKGDQIEYIGLRVNGTTTSDYEMYVGQLKLSDDYRIQQAQIDPQSFLVDVKEETQKTLSLRLTWKPNYAGYTTSIDEFGMVYNDEVHIDHFEIMYKEGKDGKAKEVGRTSQWAAFVGNLPCAQTTEAYIGVRSVSEDLHCMSPVVWVAVPHSTGTLPTVEEEDPYGKTWMSSDGNGTHANNIRNIFPVEVSTTGATQNLNFTASSNPDQSGNQYYFAEDHTLIVNQGQTVTLKFRGYDSGTGESLKYDFLNAYMDYDGNYSFLDADEALGKVGTLNSSTPAIVSAAGQSFTFKVPDDAHLGASRLRIVGSDAWTPHPGPTGGTVKGYSIDFPVLIQGTNADRGPAKTYKDFRDAGEADEPEFIETGVLSIEEIAANGTIASVEINGDEVTFTNCDKAWFFDVNGRTVKFVKNATEVVSVADLVPGVYIVRMQNGQVLRSAKIVKK